MGSLLLGSLIYIHTDTCIDKTEQEEREEEEGHLDWGDGDGQDGEDCCATVQRGG